MKRVCRKLIGIMSCLMIWATLPALAQNEINKKPLQDFANDVNQKLESKEVDLTKKPLGSTVALIGKNGAGKSRILKFVEAYIQNLNSTAFLEEHFQYLPESVFNPVFLNSIESAKKIFKQTKSPNINQENIQN